MSAAAAVYSPAILRQARSIVIGPDVSVAEADGWRVLCATRDESHPSWRRMLAANSTLPPRLKYALDPRSWHVELRAECLASEVPLARACENFIRGAVPVMADVLPLDAETDAAMWIELCESAGWKAEERANGTVVVPLPTGRHIRIESNDGAVRAVLDLGEIERDESTATRARELLLLTLAHELRMIRPLLRGREAGAHTIAEIEVGFTHKPESEEWHHALSALALAAAPCAEVFDALGDENLASQYLAIRQPHTRPPV